MARLIRARDNRRETLTLIAGDYEIAITIEAIGLDLDATTIEQMLHAPLRLIAENFTRPAAQGDA
jgi:hypothetical protein